MNESRRCVSSLRLSFACIIAFLTVCVVSSSAYGQSRLVDVQSALADAEDAYQLVDFESVYRKANRALSLGGGNAKTTARLHWLLGLAATALGHEDEARNYFIVALALSPTTIAERSLSPRLRGPYLEAVGYWEAYQERLRLSLDVDVEKSELNIGLEDPAKIAVKLVVGIRKIGEKKFELTELDSGTIATIPLASEMIEGGFEYYGNILDSNGNVLFEHGIARSAMIERAQTAKKHERLKAARLPVKQGAVETSAVPWWPRLLVGTGLLAVGLGAAMNYRREDLAEEWNSPRCEKPGQTRLAQCNDINSARKNAERLAIGLYAGGGALVVGGVIAWVTSARERNVGNGAAMQHVNCQVAVVDALGVTCVGSF